MESNAGPQQCGSRLTLTLDGSLEGPPPPADRAVPVPTRLLCRRRASEGIGGARGLGNLVRPESHPEPRGFRGAVGRRPGRPHFSKSGPPVERRPFCDVKPFFVNRRHLAHTLAHQMAPGAKWPTLAGLVPISCPRGHFSRFDPKSRTLAASTPPVPGGQALGRVNPPVSPRSAPPSYVTPPPPPEPPCVAPRADSGLFAPLSQY
jgi:hypothetical protein